MRRREIAGLIAFHQTNFYMPRNAQDDVRRTYKNKKLARALQATYGEKPLRALAAQISEERGVTLTHGTLHRALNGQMPKRKELRQALRPPAAPRAGPTPRQKRWLAILGTLWGGNNR